MAEATSTKLECTVLPPLRSQEETNRPNKRINDEDEDDDEEQTLTTQKPSHEKKKNRLDEELPGTEEPRFRPYDRSPVLSREQYIATVSYRLDSIQALDTAFELNKATTKRTDSTAKERRISLVFMISMQTAELRLLLMSMARCHVDDMRAVYQYVAERDHTYDKAKTDKMSGVELMDALFARLVTVTERRRALN